MGEIVTLFVVCFAGFLLFSQEICIYYKNMKKIFGIISAFVAMLSISSCGPVELVERWEHYIGSVYTVNKHAVIPEFSDTFYMVSNMDGQPLKTGDRARMVLRYHYDSRTDAKPQYTIVEVGEIIPTRTLDSIAAVDTLAYDATLMWALYDLGSRYVYPWVWNNCQNVNVAFYGVKESAAFAMTVKGVQGDNLELELFADIEKSKDENTQLLTYDLSNAADYLTAEQKRSLEAYDTLRTKIYFNFEDKDSLGNAVVRKVNISGGKFANPFRK